jgi:hypothetical protein
MALNEDATMLARIMLEAGREPIWVLLMVSAYYGESGRQAALALLEGQPVPGTADGPSLDSTRAGSGALP